MLGDIANPTGEAGPRLRAESREPRAESREPRAESREPRAESREPRAESREPRAESREPRAESREPRAESREPESREPRAELCPWRGSPPRLSPSPSRAFPHQSDTDPYATGAPAALACSGSTDEAPRSACCDPRQRDRRAGNRPGRSILRPCRRGPHRPPEPSPPAPGGLPSHRFAFPAAVRHAAAFARLRPALFRAAASLVPAMANLPGDTGAPENQAIAENSSPGRGVHG